MFECPNCKEFTIEVDVEVDHNYGADADGNRGGYAVFAEITGQDCDCELTDAEQEMVCNEACEAYENGDDYDDSCDDWDWDD